MLQITTSFQRKLSVFFGALLIPFFALAQSSSTTASPTYETALVLPWNFVQQSLTSYSRSNPGPLSFDLGPFSVEAQGVPVTVPGAHVDIVMTVKPVQATGNETVWRADGVKTQISLQGFSVLKTVNQIVNGIPVTVTLSAQCSAFSLIQNNGSAEMHWIWSAADNSLHAELRTLTLGWPANSWQVSQLSCTGAGDFAGLVQSELQKQLAQPEAIAEMAKPYAQNALNEQMAQALNRWKVPRTINDGKQALTIVLSGTQTINSKGVLLTGLARLGTQSPDRDGTVVPLNLTESTVQQVGDQPTLVISKKTIDSLVRQKSLWPKVTTNLNKISGFQDLLGSRFIQFFVWPDLFNYNTNSPFSMVSEVQGTPKITLSSANKAWVEGDVSSWVISKRQNKSWYYIHLQSQIAAWMTYGISKGQFNVTLQKSDVKNAQVGFGLDYVGTFNPNTYIATSTIVDAANEAQAAQSQSVTIPSIQVFEGLTLQAVGLSRPSDGFFFVKWDRVP